MLVVYNSMTEAASRSSRWCRARSVSTSAGSRSTTTATSATRGCWWRSRWHPVLAARQWLRCDAMCATSPTSRTRSSGVPSRTARRCRQLTNALHRRDARRRGRRWGSRAPTTNRARRKYIRPDVGIVEKARGLTALPTGSRDGDMLISPFASFRPTGGCRASRSTTSVPANGSRSIRARTIRSTSCSGNRPS